MPYCLSSILYLWLKKLCSSKNYIMTAQHDILLQELSESIQNTRSLQTMFDTAQFDMAQYQYEMETLRQSSGQNTNSGSQMMKTIEQGYQEKYAYSCKILEGLLPSVNSGIEKTKLVFDLLKYDLENWKISQKIAQISPRIEALHCYIELDTLDQRFEEVEKQLVDLVAVCESWLERLERTNESSIIELVSQLKAVKATLTNHLMATIAAESLVIARQPPTFLIPGRETATGQHRGVRHPCSPILRILGGECVGYRTQQHEVTCQVISEAEARTLITTPRYEPEQVGALTRSRTQFEKMPSGRFQATFDKIQLVRFRGENGSSTPRPRRLYYLVFDVKIVGRYIRLTKNILSLPFGIYVNIVQRFDHGGDAFLWWQLAFCKGNGVLSESAPSAVPWDQAIEALDKKFQQLIEEPDKPCDLDNPPEPPRGLNAVARNHLSEKLNKNGYLNWNDFFMEKICFVEKKGKEIKATFKEWFYTAGQTINYVFKDYWNKGLITAFADAVVAEGLVAKDPKESMMLIRFSDTWVGHLMFTHHLPKMGNKAEHMSLETKLLENMTLDLADVILKDQTLKDIKYIYPEYPIPLLSKDVPVPQETKQTKQRRWGYEVKEMTAGIAYVPRNPIEAELEAAAAPENNINPYIQNQWYLGQEEPMLDEYYNFDQNAFDQMPMNVPPQPDYEQANLENDFFHFAG